MPRDLFPIGSPDEDDLRVREFFLDFLEVLCWIHTVLDDDAIDAMKVLDDLHAFFKRREERSPIGLGDFISLHAADVIVTRGLGGLKQMKDTLMKEIGYNHRIDHFTDLCFADFDK